MPRLWMGAQLISKGLGKYPALAHSVLCPPFSSGQQHAQPGLPKDIWTCDYVWAAPRGVFY